MFLATYATWIALGLILALIGLMRMMAMTVYVILDVEYPRIGFIRINQTDQVLVDLRKSMD